MTSYLLDTNHASRLMAEDEPIISRVQGARAAGHRLGLSITVLGELHYAVYGSGRRAWNRRRLEEMVANYLLWAYDEPAAEEFGRIRAEQKVGGRPIPPLDVQIAAVARLHGLTLLTADRHFGFVAGLAVENWLGP